MLSLRRKLRLHHGLTSLEIETILAPPPDIAAQVCGDFYGVMDVNLYDARNEEGLEGAALVLTTLRERLHSYLPMKAADMSLYVGKLLPQEHRDYLLWGLAYECVYDDEGDAHWHHECCHLPWRHLHGSPRFTLHLAEALGRISFPRGSGFSKGLPHPLPPPTP